MTRIPSGGLLVEYDGTTANINLEYGTNGININPSATAVALTPLGSQIRLTGISVAYTAQAPVVDPNYTTVTYVPGTPMTMAEDGIGLYMVVTEEICPNITTNTTTITVNPKPVLEVGDLDHNICLVDAVEALDDAIENVQFADEQGWLVPTTPTVIWNEGFESGEIPTTWTTVTDGEGAGWTVTDDDANTGSNSSVSSSYYAGSSYEVDDWLITPATNNLWCPFGNQNILMAP